MPEVSTTEMITRLRGSIRSTLASISRVKEAKPTKLELTDEERKALPPPVRREAPPAEPMGPVRDYPPLEKS